MPPPVQDATSPLHVATISIFQNSVKAPFASSYHKCGTAMLSRKGTYRRPESWGACRTLHLCSQPIQPQCCAPKVVLMVVHRDAGRAEMNSSSPMSECSISCYSKTSLRPKTEEHRKHQCCATWAGERKRSMADLPSNAAVRKQRNFPIMKRRTGTRSIHIRWNAGTEGMRADDLKSI